MSETEFGHVASRIGAACFDVWGTGPFEIADENGKKYRFEDSDRWGPHLIKRNGDLLTNGPSETSPFWRAHRIWARQGRRVEADGISCIWDAA